MTKHETDWTKHPWSEAGLGVGPYRFKGYEKRTFQAIPGDPNCPIQPGGTCDFCPSPIALWFWFESSDGRRFKVGCECAKKGMGEWCNASADEIRSAPLWVRRMHRDITQAERAQASADRAERHARKLARLPALLSEPDVAAAVSAFPHPNAYRASLANTLLDWMAWTARSGSATGKMKALKKIKDITGRA